jgi:hypothetical protein
MNVIVHSKQQRASNLNQYKTRQVKNNKNKKVPAKSRGLYLNLEEGYN